MPRSKKDKKRKTPFTENVIEVRRKLEKDLNSTSPSIAYLAMAVVRGCKAFLTGDEVLLINEKMIKEKYGVTVTADYALAMSIVAYNESQVIGVPYK